MLGFLLTCAERETWQILQLVFLENIQEKSKVLIIMALFINRLIHVPCVPPLSAAG